MTKMTRSAKNNPEFRSALPWLLLAGCVLALGAFLLRPETPPPAAPVPLAHVPKKIIPTVRPASVPVPPVPTSPPAIPLAVHLVPSAPLVHTDGRLRRSLEDEPWQLPVVGLSPEATRTLTPEQREQFEKLSRAFLDETADPAISRDRWAQARAATDGDFRAFFGDELYFEQQHRVALQGTDAATDASPTSDQP